MAFEVIYPSALAANTVLFVSAYSSGVATFVAKSTVATATADTIALRDGSGDLYAVALHGSLAFSSITGTLTSSQFAALISDETGSGVLVFGTSPTITTPTIAKLANLTGNGFVKTSGGDGTLSVDTATYLTSSFAGSSSIVTTGTVTSGTWSGSFGAVSGANLTTLNASNISSGTLSQDRFALASVSAYGTGSAYTVTNTSAAVDLGTIDPSITIATAGTYLLYAAIKLILGGTQSSFTFSYKYRRTNNTAADIGAIQSYANGNADGIGADNGLTVWLHLPVRSYTATAGDVVTLFASADQPTGLTVAAQTYIFAVRTA